MASKEEITNKALGFFSEGYACSQAVSLAFADIYNIDKKTILLASSTFGGGMGRLREKCGSLTGAFMILGHAFGTDDPKDLDKKLFSYKQVRLLDSKIYDIYGTTQCGELLQKHASEADVVERKHHTKFCTTIIKQTTEELYDILLANNKI